MTEWMPLAACAAAALILAARGGRNDEGGGTAAADILTCQRKPATDADHLPAVFGAAEKVRQAAIFPAGAFDFSKAGVERVPRQGPWLRQ